MKPSTNLNGYMIYNCFLSGYYKLLKKKKYLNSINLFPVPDGDTGTNMVQTFFSALQIESVYYSAGKTLERIADKLLSGARGNSGIIISQFINSLSESCSELRTINTYDFSEALKNAAEQTYHAVNKPVEGTIITVIMVWSEEMSRLSNKYHDFKDLIIQSRYAVDNALEKTKEQLPVLKKANVVDAGASGFVSFLEGIVDMIISGIIPDNKRFLSDYNEAVFLDDHDNDYLSGNGKIIYRYCSEVLIKDVKQKSKKISEDLNKYGDSLILSGSCRKLKIHIHTNNPVLLFHNIAKHGTIIESKIDDMFMQYNVNCNPLSETAIVTDSIADIPLNIIDKYQIHTINLNIIWDDNIFIDRLNIDSKKLYSNMEKSRINLSTSLPDPLKVKEKFLSLLSIYKSVIVITVSSELSGTWQIMENCAKELRGKGYKINIIDSRLNSAAQGLVAVKAALDAANKVPADSIINSTLERIKKSRIYVSVPTLKYMVRGGRVSPMKGMAAAILNLKPVVSLDRYGRSIKYGAAFTQKGTKKKIFDILDKYKDEIDCYNVVHAGIRDEAEIFAENIYTITGIKADYIMEISSTVGIHTGKGVLAAGLILK